MEPQKPDRRPSRRPPPKITLREAWEELRLLLYFVPRLLAAIALLVFGLVLFALLLCGLFQGICTL